MLIQVQTFQHFADDSYERCNKIFINRDKVLDIVPIKNTVLFAVNFDLSGEYFYIIDSASLTKITGG
jgi:hypothetical protein